MLEGELRCGAKMVQTHGDCRHELIGSEAIGDARRGALCRSSIVECPLSVITTKGSCGQTHASAVISIANSRRCIGMAGLCR